MPSEEQCIIFNQEIESVKEQSKKIRQDLHTEMSDLRDDFNNHVAEQSSRYSDLVQAQKFNTEAVTKLTKNTQDLVDAITAGRLIGRLVRWSVPVLISIGSAAAYFSKLPPFT